MSALRILCLAVAVVALVSGSDDYRRVPNYRPTPAPYHKPTPAPYHRPTPAPYHPAPKPVPSYRRGHTVVDDCTCFEKGNYYSPVSSNNCHSFSQRTAFLPAVVQNCPYGLQFNVKTCVCDYPKNTVCPSYCPRAYKAPATSYDTCFQNGNTYAQVPRTHCSKFTQATATLPPQVHYCPAGLQFDLKTCVCNYPKNTVCRV